LELEATCHLENLLFHQVRYAPNLQMRSHLHAEASLILLLRGTTRTGCRKQSYTSGPSTLLFLPAGEAHTAHFLDEVRTFEILVGAPWLDRLRQAFTGADTAGEYRDSLPTWLALRLYREFQHRDNVTPLMLEGLMLELFGEMARCREDSTAGPVPRPLARARDFLHAHFAESHSLEAIAAASGIHPAHLTRAFRRHFHCTVGEYVRRLRVEFAAHLLSSTDTPLLQVALNAGFADQCHFSRTFKSVTGMTPGQYQKLSGRAAER
jgi:AraC family transcriptional regulator